MAIVKKRRQYNTKSVRQAQQLQQQQLQQQKKKLEEDRLKSVSNHSMIHDESDTISFRSNLLKNFIKSASLINSLTLKPIPLSKIEPVQFYSNINETISQLELKIKREHDQLISFKEKETKIKDFTKDLIDLDEKLNSKIDWNSMESIDSFLSIYSQKFNIKLQSNNIVKYQNDHKFDILKLDKSKAPSDYWLRYKAKIQQQIKSQIEQHYKLKQKQNENQNQQPRQPQHQQPQHQQPQQEGIQKDNLLEKENLQQNFQPDIIYNTTTDNLIRQESSGPQIQLNLDTLPVSVANFNNTSDANFNTLQNDSNLNDSMLPTTTSGNNINSKTDNDNINIQSISNINTVSSTTSMDNINSNHTINNIDSIDNLVDLNDDDNNKDSNNNNNDNINLNIDTSNKETNTLNVNNPNNNSVNVNADNNNINDINSNNQDNPDLLDDMFNEYSNEPFNNGFDDDFGDLDNVFF